MDAPRLTGGVDADSYRVAPLRPLVDPLDVRDATVRDYAAAARRAGREVNGAELERVAAAHLSIVDAYKAGHDVTAPSKPAEPAPSKAQAAVAEDDTVKLKERGAPDRNVLLHGRGRPDGRWAHARARLRRILEGMTPQFVQTANGAELDFTASTATAQIPMLARRYYRLWGNFLQRHRRSRHNPFAGLSDHDALRMFQAEVYSICDASTGRLGQWWVPR